MTGKPPRREAGSLVPPRWHALDPAGAVAVVASNAHQGLRVEEARQRLERFGPNALPVVFLPALNQIFHTVPISLREVLAIAAVASLVLWVEELRKLVVRRREAQVR